MKYLKSIITFTFMALCLTAIFTITSSAKSKETTYIAAENAYVNTFAKAYFEDDTATDGEGFKIEYSDGKILTVIDYNEDIRNNPWYELLEWRDIQFYLRGSTLYYSVTALDNYSYKLKANIKHVNEIHKVTKDGRNIVVAKEVGDLLGGYGEDFITIRRDTLNVYRVHNGKATKLFKVKTKEKTFQNTNVTLFGGKLYFDNKVYNLDTGKTSTFTAKSRFATKTYMYYTSGVDNLVMMDLNGKKTYLDKKVSEVIGGNTNKNAVYIKNDAFYRVSSTGKIYKLATMDSVKKCGLCSSPDTFHAVLVNGMVCIVLYVDYHDDQGFIAKVKNTGGKPTFVSNGPSCFSGWNVIGNRIYYSWVEFDDESIQHYESVDI